MAAEVVVLGCGLMTPVGLSAPEVAASARARIQRLGEIEIRDRRFRRFVVGAVPDEGLPDPDEACALLPARVIRMQRLAEVPLLEALAGLPQDAGPVPLFLGLPEIPPTRPIDGPRLLAWLAEHAPLDAKSSAIVPEGRASSLVALAMAARQLTEGQARYCVVGGLDSQLDLSTLGALDAQGRVRSEVNPDGFAPGEGAGFLLLCLGDRVHRHGLKPLARVVACAAGVETGHLASEEPYRGDGLAAAFTAAFQAAGDLPHVGCVYASFNGERYWAKEFGVAMLRNRDAFDPAYQMEHPAECFGDLGAAHGAVLLGLACLGLERGYRRAPTLVYSSSDLGRRAVALLDRMPAQAAPNAP